MSQATTWGMQTTGPATGAQVASRVNDSLNALLSNHIGASAPGYVVAGATWADSSVANTYTFKVFDGAQHIPYLKIDTTNNVAYFLGGLGSELGDQATGGNGNTGRTVLKANNDSFEVLTEDGTTGTVLQARWADSAPLFKGNAIVVNGVTQTITGSKTFTTQVNSSPGGAGHGFVGTGNGAGGAGMIGYPASQAIYGALGFNTGGTDYSYYGSGRGYNVGQFEVGGILYSTGSMNSTTASAANVWQNSSAGNYARSTSSSIYKTDIEPLMDEYADEFLALEPVWYRSNHLTVDDPSYSWYGFIAEQVADIDPRLVHWARKPKRDEEGKILKEQVGVNRFQVPDGTDEAGQPKFREVEDPVYANVLEDEETPDGVQYERLIVLAQRVVKRHDDKLKALEAENAQLKADLAAIKAHLGL